MKKTLVCLLLSIFMLLYTEAKAADIAAAEKAIAEGNISSLEAMIKDGLDINARNAEGYPLVYLVVANTKSLQMLRLLAENGAQLDAPAYENGETPLIYAVSGAERLQTELEKAYVELSTQDDWEKKEAQLKKKVISEMIHITKTVRLLVDLGVDIDLETPFGTPLMKAATNPWNAEIVKILLEAGANVNKEDQNGRTALFYSEAYGCDDITMQLIAAGGDVSHLDNDGKTYMDIDKEDIKTEEIIHDM